MKTVLVGGCFDLLHYGHIAFLKQARALGDRLVVMLESDETIRRLKGHARPIHSQDNRREMLETLSVVDDVISLPPLKEDAEYAALVEKIHPDIIAVTEGDPIMEKKRNQAQSIGATLIVIPNIRTPSTSQLSKLLGLE